MSQRDDLLAGAKQCLIEKGYSKTTARDIAAASGAHLASIGYHFGSKDNLMNLAVLEATSEWGNTITAAVREAGGHDPTHRLRITLEHLLGAIARDRELLVTGIQAYAQAQFDEQLRTKLAEGIREGRIALAAMVLGIDADRVDADTETGLGSVVYNLVTSFVLQALVDPASVPSPDTIIESLRRLV